MATRAKPGSGKRFAHLVHELESKGYSEKSARAIAATVGREKYGSKQIAQWSAEGRRRHRHHNPRAKTAEPYAFNQKGILITLGVVGAALGAAYLLTRKKSPQGNAQPLVPTVPVGLPSRQAGIRASAV